MTFSQASKPAVDPGFSIEDQPDEYSTPASQQDSASEHSSHSQKSLDKVYFGKSFQANPSHPRSDSSFHRNNRSHGSLSSRSSINGVISDRGDSLGSVRSRDRGKGELGTVGQLGSEGSDYTRRDALNQIRSLGSLGRRSDNESF